LSEFGQLAGVDDKHFRLTLSGRQYVFPLPSNKRFEDLKAEIEGYRARLVEALSGGDRRALAGLDPVRDSGFSNPLSSRASLTRRRNSHTALTAAAAVAGAVLASLFFLARNSLAERSIYRQAVERNTETSYQAYLE